MRALLLALALLAGPAAAQDRAATLADIRQELTVLNVEMQRLRRELSTTGAAALPSVGGGTLERLDAVEAELRRVTAKAEELEFRIGRVVEDGTNRIADLEFRLVELEGGDVGQLGDTPRLGGEVGLPAQPTPETGDAQVPQLAMGEQADFTAAVTLSEEGTPADAEAALTAFVQTYPRSPLTAQAQYRLGRALRDLGNLQAAGRAFLESYTLAETSDAGLAADALTGLGGTLADLGQVAEACIALGQVGTRFPGTNAVPRAQDRLAGLTCS